MKGVATTGPTTSATSKNTKGNSNTGSSSNGTTATTNTNTTKGVTNHNTSTKTVANTTLSSSSPASPFASFYQVIYSTILIYMLYVAIQQAYTIRLRAIQDYGPVIHEFDPYFNYRATEVRSLLFSFICFAYILCLHVCKPRGYDTRLTTFFCIFLFVSVSFFN